jgi:hypothetical protein
MLKFFLIICFKRQDLKKLQGRKKIPNLVEIQELFASSQHHVESRYPIIEKKLFSIISNETLFLPIFTKNNFKNVVKGFIMLKVQSLTHKIAYICCKFFINNLFHFHGGFHC